MKLYPFPDPATRETIKTIIRLQVERKITYQQMMTVIAKILTDYNVLRIKIDDFEVHLGEVIETLAGKFPTVYLHSKKQGNLCPSCQSDEYEYLAGEEPCITAYCMNCGCIYLRRVTDEASNEKPSIFSHISSSQPTLNHDCSYRRGSIYRVGVYELSCRDG